MWVSCSSHRARAKLDALVGSKLPSYGVWPKRKDGTTDWPRGEFYQVPDEFRDAIGQIKGLRVMAREPRGEIFRRGWGL